MRNQWTSLASFMLMLIFAAAADGLMDALGPAGFLCVGVFVMGAVWILVGAERGERADGP